MQLIHPDPEDFSLAGVLSALGNPIRLEVVRRLSQGEQLNCTTALPHIPQSTASHHWRVLRESGLLQQTREGRVINMTLRKADIDSRFPGLLDAVIEAEQI